MMTGTEKWTWKDLKNTETVAGELGISPRTLRDWARRGLIAVTRGPTGRRLRWSEEQVDRIRADMVVTPHAGGEEGGCRT